MARYTFSRVETKDPTVFMLQSAIETAFRSLDTNPILDGQLITNVTVGTAEIRVRHSLKRKPKGYLVVDADAAATIHRSSESTTQFLHLTSSHAATISLWVF